MKPALDLSAGAQRTTLVSAAALRERLRADLARDLIPADAGIVRAALRYADGDTVALRLAGHTNVSVEWAQTSQRITTQAVGGGDGWTIDKIKCPRLHGGGVTKFAIYEDGQVWPNSGEPRETLTVEVEHPREAFGALQPAGVSWPSTSDHRVELAAMVAEALRLAVTEATLMNQKAGL